MSGWQVFVEVAGRPPFELRPGESIIGRSRMAQVHIPESTVSRQHARLLTSPLGEVTVEDLGSSNGTYVNNEKVEGRRRLADGDRIHVGDAELRLRIVAPVAASEATVRMSLPPMSGPPPAQPLPAAPPPATPPAPAPQSPPMPDYSTPPVPLDLPLGRQPPIAPSLPAAPPPRPAAAPPMMAAPPPAPPVPRRPVPPPAAPAPALPSRRPESVRGPELPSVTAIDRIPIPEPTPEVIRASRLSRAVPATLGVRFAAALVDAALITFIAIPLWIVLALAVGRSPMLAGLLVPVVFLVIIPVYLVVFWATKGATPGKIFLKLLVVGSKRSAEDGLGWSVAIVRALGYVVSIGLAFIPFLLVLFTAQKQGLHDLIAGTRVVRLR